MTRQLYRLLHFTHLGHQVYGMRLMKESGIRTCFTDVYKRTLRKRIGHLT